MPKIAFGAGLLAALLLAQAASADTLKYVDGGQVKGRIEEVSFAAGDTQSLYPRENLASVQLSEEGKDRVELQDGTKREGKLLTVRMKSSGGVLAVGRRELKGIELNAEAIPEEPKPAEPTPETTPETALTDAQKEALAKNKELLKKCLDEVAELRKKELTAFKDKNESGQKELVAEVGRLKTTIENKERARRERASQASRADSRWNQPYNDGLENDYRALSKARDKLAALERKLKTEKTKLLSGLEDLERNAQRASAANRAEIRAGKELSEEAMKARYDRALQSKSDDEKKSK